MLSGDALFRKIEEEMGSGKFVVAEIAPALRVSLGEEFGMGTVNAEGKVVSLLKEMGFREVFDTSFGADLIVAAEVPEFIKSLGKGVVFNSCCIGWRIYAMQRHKEVMPNISRYVSPQMAVGSVVKFYWAPKNGIRPEDVVVVGIMPCTLKKHETKERMKNGLVSVDYVLDTQEVARWAKAKGLDLRAMPEGKIKFSPSKNGLIFGSTGGVAESLLTNMAAYLGKPKEVIDFRTFEKSVKKTVKIGSYTIRVATVFGYPALEEILKEKDSYDFIEVMACAFGCVGGPGQPTAKGDALMQRAKLLRESADALQSKNSFDNPELKEVMEWIRSLSKEKFEEYFLLPSQDR
ncbi:MAG: [Fe-Fe] hydrogenase large subunit C-terminal domain-containing protein [Candidatus Anstonellales archaeon]